MPKRDMPEMELVFDEDTRAVFEFMVANVSTAKLVSVATAVAQLAPALWGHYPQEEVRALALRYPPIEGPKLRRQSSASESGPETASADDDFAEETA